MLIGTNLQLIISVLSYTTLYGISVKRTLLIQFFFHTDRKNAGFTVFILHLYILYILEGVMHYSVNIYTISD